MRRIGRRLPALVLLVLIAAGLFWLGRYLRERGITWASEFSSVASLFVAVFALVAPVLARWLRDPAPMSQVSVVQGGDDLATSLGKQWEEEDRLRRINDPRPLPVRWDVTPTALAAMAGVPSEQCGNADLAGSFAQIRATFDRVKSRRLVILGAAGAGKSVLVIKLARELLAVRQSGMPIPVILPAATWDPDNSLTDWISDQLASNHPGLALRVKTVSGEVTSLADALATRGVLPILDGLDELPPKLRTKAISEINALGSDYPLVITSRPNEYLQAIASAGRGVSRAMAVELLPLRVQEARDYLGEATAVIPPGRWNRVFEQLDSEPDEALTKVLTTPLMLWLARTVYENTGDQPSELVTSDNLRTREQIEHHLLDAFVPAVYAKRSERSKFNCTPSQAQRWLGFIATYLDKTGSPDLAWWRLTRATRIWRPLGVGIRSVLSLVVAWTLTVGVLRRHGYLQHRAYPSHGHISDFILSGSLGEKIRPTVDQWLAIIQHDASVHKFVKVALTPIRWFSWSSLPLLALQIGLLATLLGVFAAAEGFIVPPRAIRLRSFRPNRQVISALALIYVYIVLLMWLALRYSPTASAARAVLHTPSGHLFILMLCFLFFPLPPVSAQVEETHAISPASVLRLDRQADLLRTLLGTTLTATYIFLITGWEITLAYCMWSVARILIRFSLGSTRNASELFDDARIWLACGRRLPWRPMRFLVDAHQRGVLRQAGAVYQFRHIRLQERLSSPSRLSFYWVPIIKLAQLKYAIRSYYEESLGGGRVRAQKKWQVHERRQHFRRTGFTTLVYRDPRFDQLTSLQHTEEDEDLPGSTDNQE